jgi:hypothetical protein
VARRSREVVASHESLLSKAIVPTGLPDTANRMPAQASLRVACTAVTTSDDGWFRIRYAVGGLTAHDVRVRRWWGRALIVFRRGDLITRLRRPGGADGALGPHLVWRGRPPARRRLATCAWSPVKARPADGSRDRFGFGCDFQHPAGQCSGASTVHQPERCRGRFGDSNRSDARVTDRLEQAVSRG